MRLKIFLKQNKHYNFSILHLNIRSLLKNTDSLRILLSQLNFLFKGICLTVTWFEQENESNVFLYSLPNYARIHLVWKNCKGGSLRIYSHTSLVFTEKENLSTNCDGTETLVIQINCGKYNNVIFNLVYRPPN